MHLCLPLCNRANTADSFVCHRINLVGWANLATPAIASLDLAWIIPELVVILPSESAPRSLFPSG